MYYIMYYYYILIILCQETKWCFQSGIPGLTVGFIVAVLKYFVLMTSDEEGIV